MFRAAPPAAAFAAFGATPALLLIAGAIGGGWPLWMALGWIALLAPAADSLLGRSFPDAARQRHFAGTETGLLILATCHFTLLATALHAMGSSHLPTAQRIALFLGTGMYLGQISNATAHELIHRARALPFALGAAIYTSLLFGHHTSAHRLVHHRHVATDADPNSARLGESFWQFWPRAWIGSFRTGLRAEQHLCAAKPGRLNPYHLWASGALIAIGLTGLLAGPRATADYLGLCLYAQMQLLLSDYVQHYGLRRGSRPDGRPNPITPRHSWDSPHPLSSLAMVNAPRHSDHHLNASRAYPALRLNRAESPRPMLPYPLPVMASAALIPPLWRRIMDRRAQRMNAH